MEVRNDRGNEEMKQYVRLHGGIFSTKRYVEDLLITPEMANHFLNTMGKNRRLRPAVVQKYCNDMKNGTFKDSPALICFDWNGQLRDGQHRMQAIVDCGIPITMSLKFDFDPDTIYDKNAGRSTADTFAITGMVSQSLASKEITSIINSAVLAKFGSNYLKWMSDNQKLDFANAYGAEMLVANSIAKAEGSHGICDLGSIKAGIFSALIYGISEETLTHFAECANTFTATSKGETAATVFARQISKMADKNSQTARREIVKITEEAIQSFVFSSERKVKFPGDKHVYFDKIELQF